VTIFLCKLPILAQSLGHGLRAAYGQLVVPNNLSEQIRECLQHAEDCARKAATLPLPKGSRFKQDFLDLEQHWLELARSIEFGESIDRFSKYRAAPNIKPNA
jgi:hypothetical protein